jgi:predicted ATPase
VQVHALGPIPVKGLAEPVEVFELLGASTVRRRLQASAARGLTRFVGRQYELESLRQALERVGAGHGQVVAAVGEAGVGKSRLVYEFVHSHRTQGWLVLESASVSYGKATPYFPVLDLLKRYAHVEEHDDTRTVRAKVTGQVLTLDETLQDTVPALLALLDALPEDSPFLRLDPSQRRQRTLAALKRVLLRESQGQPLLLVFEDLHWIDAETQALLDSLVESLPTARLLLLVNYRPEYQHGWGSKTYYTQLRLDPLPPASAEEFLQALLGDDPRVEPLKRLLIARTEGNPFFLEESVRTLVETGILVGERGAYRLVQALPTIQVPATVQAVLAARIDRLPPEEKRLLQTSAVIGTEVPFPLLRAIAELPEEALHGGLAHLQAAEFLYETHLFPEPEYTFKHALTHEVAYASLLMTRRQALHAAAGQALETLYAPRLEKAYERLAYHYARTDHAAKAVGYLTRVAEKAARHSAHVEAISHLTQALELLQRLPATPERSQQELTLHIALGASLIATKGYAAPEVAQTYTRARQLSQHLEDPQQHFPVLRGLWHYYLVRAELQTAHALGEQLLTLAQQAQDPAMLVAAHRALGATLFYLGAVASALTHLAQGMALYDSQQHRTAAFLYGDDAGVVCHSIATWALWYLGYPDQGVARSHEALTLAQQSAHPFSLGFALCWVAAFHQYRREVQATQEYARAALSLATEQGFPLLVAYGSIQCGWALAQQGQGREGIEQLQQGLIAFRATGAEVIRPYLLALLAEAYGIMGQPEAGLTAIAEALTLVDKTGERWYEPELHRLQGALLLQQSPDNHTEAHACFQHALDLARAQQARSLELRAATSLARLWQQQGKRHEARQLLAEVYNWFTEGFDTADLQEARALLDELA